MGATDDCDCPGTGGEVLVVDDDPAAASLASEYLGRLGGVSVVAETDPAVALDRIERPSVACVVSDYQMPEMDGIEFLTAVRERRPDLDAVLFTGADEEGVRERARDRGATYLRKGGSAGGYHRLAEAVADALGADGR